MRFTYAEAMVDPAYYLPLARAADAAGFDGFLVPDSICYPAESEATYPYTADGDRGFIEDKPFLEPFSIIPALGALVNAVFNATGIRVRELPITPDKILMAADNRGLTRI